MKVICNQADNEKCSGCRCSMPHNKREHGEEYCTSWGDCFDKNGMPLFRVRCISVDSKRGREICKNLGIEV